TETGQTVTVPGKFTFCAYDETNGKAENVDGSQVKPTRTWEFSESEMRRSLKKDLVGWSYSFWLPYAAPGPAEHRCSLMVIFTPEQGQRVVSDWSQVTLPGIRGTQGVQSLAANPKDGATTAIKTASTIETPSTSAVQPVAP